MDVIDRQKMKHNITFWPKTIIKRNLTLKDIYFNQWMHKEKK